MVNISDALIALMHDGSMQLPAISMQSLLQRPSRVYMHARVRRCQNDQICRTIPMMTVTDNAFADLLRMQPVVFVVCKVRVGPGCQK